MQSRSTWALAFFIAFPLASYAQAPKPQLQHITSKAGLIFQELDGHCFSGNLLKSDATTVTVEQYSTMQTHKTVQLPLTDLLFIGETLESRNALFSSRNSWTDLTSLEANRPEYLRITLKTGVTVDLYKPKVTAGTISGKAAGHQKTYSKDEIGTLDYLRYYPVTDSIEYLGQEAFPALLLTPQFYGRITGLSPKITVRLYDSRLPETSVPLTCKRDQSN